MRAVQVSHVGGPEVLEVVDISDPTAGPGEVVVDVAAAGVNFIDTYWRTGLYRLPLPFINGTEAAGTVVEVGASVGHVAVGDRVAWSSGMGAYAERVAVDSSAVVPVPDGVDLETAAAVMLQGLTAHYLAVSTYELHEGDRCLVHAAAGGVGALLVQIAKMRGAEVFATVGSDEKVEIAAAAGADHVINYRDHDFAEAVTGLVGPNAMDVVYDGVGASTFDSSIRLLRPRGTMATFGNASGPVEPVSPLLLSSLGSLFLTRPTLNDHIATPADLKARTDDLFAWISEGTLTVRIGARYDLAQAAKAHSDLESRATVGKLLLIP